ncbi:hypothetical protein QNI19_14705 [Cytophagaceae bacterium DM2B3-1]|uniref:Integrase catalytic domain-containing protein n=1 Tax=Xanthocytophaga flava TaxID=3048013 RepID=A0ABT7CKE7_9BACT|nr:hypothetical protein [Xanthocytophaga flavus]MDJ1494191.1 hypothetical protein [Xanthocytophaga flavus]
MELLENDIAVNRQEILKVVSEKALETALQRNKISSIKRGVYSYESLPPKWQELLKTIYCYGHEPYEFLAAFSKNESVDTYKQRKARIAALIKTDAEELQTLQVQVGKKLATGYARLCAWLRFMAETTRQDCIEKWGLDGKEELYKVCLEAMQKEFDNNQLAGQRISEIRPLQNKITAFVREGTVAVINKKVGKRNLNAKKMSEAVEKVLVILLTRTMKDNRIYLLEAWKQYQQFMSGLLQIVDTDSGEIFAPVGMPALSLSTVKRALKQPAIEAEIQRLSRSGLDYSNSNKGHALRKAPTFSLSLASMDDQDIPYRLDTGGKAYAYYIFDVKSGAIIGVAVGVEKNAELFKASVANMMLNPALNGRMPIEIEVEQHISSGFKDTLLAKGNVFPLVKWALGGNPKEKAAERFIKRMRYDHQRQREGFLFRPKARLDANRINTDLKATKYTFKQVESFVMADVEAYNNAEHPDFKGKTRLQVLQENANPNASFVKLSEDIKYVGTKVDTTLRHNQYCIVRGEQFVIPSPDVVKRMKHYKVEAYYLPQLLGEKVWLFHEGEFLCEAVAAETVRFNVASAEWNETDQQNYDWQSAFLSEQHTMTKTGAAEIKRFEVLQSVSIDQPVKKNKTDIYDDPSLFD